MVMTEKYSTRSAEIRSKLDYPVVDCDGHIQEMVPVMEDYVRDVAGADVARDWVKSHRDPVTADRPGQRKGGAGWWNLTANTDDYASCMVPKLLYERMDRIGVDFSILFPSIVGLGVRRYRDEEMRRTVVRAYNKYAVDLLEGYRDRLMPVASIPMDTPELAIEELEYAHSIGHKAAVFGFGVSRPVKNADEDDFFFGGMTVRPELFAMDSDYDYDRVWAKCQDLGFAVVSHGGGSIGGAYSSSSYIFNHIGTLSIGHRHLVKSLFMGGVTRRFPKLRFGFLEGGVTWAVGLLCDTLAHWEKRNAKTILDLDPARLDRDRIAMLIEQYGNDRAKAHAKDMRAWLDRPQNLPPENLDEFHAAHIESEDDFRDLWMPKFFYGCEADDRGVATAFHRKSNPFEEPLHAMLGSDISHWDIPHMDETLEEAYELLEHEAISEDDFKAFVSTNCIKLHGEVNPDFFTGTVVEDEAKKVLSGG